jgi:hypothetical protein
MKKILHIILLFALLGNFSCKKEMKKTTVQGVVVDNSTRHSLSGVEVYLQEFTFDGEHFHVQKTVMQQVTAADGKFNFEFNAERHKLYGLEYQKPSECYFDREDPYEISKGKPNYIFKQLVSENTIFIHIKNISPFDSSDEICYSFEKSLTSCPYIPLIGTSVDFIYELSMRHANDKIYVKSFITKNSITTIRLDSIIVPYCNPDTLNIFY